MYAKVVMPVFLMYIRYEIGVGLPLYSFVCKILRIFVANGELCIVTTCVYCIFSYSSV